MDDLELSIEAKTKLEERRNELVRLIEAIAILSESKEWQTLKELVFDKSLASIERQILSESLAVEIKSDKLYKLQGEWVWSKQFCDTKRFIETLKIQLQEINKKIK